MKKFLFILTCMLSTAPADFLYGASILSTFGIIDLPKNPAPEFKESIRYIPFFDGLSLTMEPTGMVDLSLIHKAPKKSNLVHNKGNFFLILSSALQDSPLKQTDWLGIKEYYTLSELMEAFTVVRDLTTVGDISICGSVKHKFLLPFINPSKSEPLRSFQLKRYQLWDQLWYLRLDYMHSKMTAATYHAGLSRIETEMTVLLRTVKDTFPAPVAAIRRLSDESTLPGETAEADGSDSELSTCGTADPSDVTPLILDGLRHRPAAK